MWPDSVGTDDLLKQVETGSEGALEKLLERHRGPLVQLVRHRLDRRIAARVDASDVVQDVLLEASRRLSEYLKSPALPFHLWLRGLARDRMIDEHRRHHAGRRNVEREQQAGRVLDASAVDMIAQLPDASLTPAAAAIRRELAERFRDAIDQLDESDREIVLMRHVEQLSSQEAALALGLTPAAAGMRYLRALRRLRDILGPAAALASGVMTPQNGSIGGSRE